jgi:hypothetical protein
MSNRYRDRVYRSPVRQPSYNDSYYSDDSYYDEQPNYNSRPKLARQRSKRETIRDLFEARSLGGAIDAVRNRARSVDTSSRGRPRARHYDSYTDYERDTNDSDTTSRSRSRRSKTRSRHRRESNQTHMIRQAAGAAIAAGAAEAWRVRNHKVKLTEKGTRVATAAASAAAIAAFKDDRPGDKDKRHTAQATLGGLLVNRLANGSRDKKRRNR